MRKKYKQDTELLLTKYKLRLIGLVSRRKAAAAAFVALCTPFNGKNLSKPPAIFKSAQPVELKVAGGLVVKGFHFDNGDPSAKKILVCHGFDSSSYRFGKYVTSLIQAGFQVFTFDAPGHGLSDGNTINAMVYRNTVLDIEKLFGPFNGIMAHSLGAMAATLAIEELNDPNKKLVIIAPSTEVRTIFNLFFKAVSLRPRIQKFVHELIHESCGYPTEWFSVARALHNITGSVLWVHDTDDPICPYEDTLSTRQNLDKLPHLQFITTEGLGHARVYLNNDIHRTVINFFIDKD